MCRLVKLHHQGCFHYSNLPVEECDNVGKDCIVFEQGEVEEQCPKCKERDTDFARLKAKEESNIKAIAAAQSEGRRLYYILNDIAKGGGPRLPERAGSGHIRLQHAGIQSLIDSKRQRNWILNHQRDLLGLEIAIRSGHDQRVAEIKAIMTTEMDKMFAELLRKVEDSQENLIETTKSAKVSISSKLSGKKEALEFCDNMTGRFSSLYKT